MPPPAQSHGEAANRQAVAQIVANHTSSDLRAYRLIGFDRKSMRFRTVRQDDPVSRDRLSALAKERRRFGDRRLHIILRRDVHEASHKRLFSI